ncbi:regulator [Escherichia coli]|nr:regulator [Escherichia coli]
MLFVLPAKRSHLRGRLPEIKTTDGEVTCVGRQKTKGKSIALI